MPRGIYFLRPLRDLRLGKVVVFNIPKSLTLPSYPFLSPDEPLIKQVGALPGDTVCVDGVHVKVNGDVKGEVFKSDGRGNPLIQRVGCSTIQKGAFLPLSTYITRSFDGRYFGEIPIREVLGEASLLLTF